MEGLVNDTPETREAIERWQQGKINIGDALARLEIERNDLRTRNHALETALAYSPEGQALLTKFIEALGDRNQARKDRDEARALVIHLAEAIVSTLEENRHLADGDSCTLARLKAAVPHWK